MTLEELKAQRKEIDEQIRAMTQNAVVHGRAKFDKHHYPTNRPDEYGIYIKRNMGDTDTKECWYRIIANTDKAKAIHAIVEIVEDLQYLMNEASTKMRKGEL